MTERFELRFVVDGEDLDRVLAISDPLDLNPEQIALLALHQFLDRQ